MFLHVDALALKLAAKLAATVTQLHSEHVRPVISRRFGLHSPKASALS